MFGFLKSSANNIGTAELQRRLESGEKPLIVDVREPWEYNEGHLPGSLLRPLGQIRTWAREFDPAKEIILYCRTASRSAVAANFLKSQGFSHVKDMGGGIVTWRGAVVR